MNTNMKIPLTDEERNKLSLLIHPDKPKRLASRNDVKDLLLGGLQAWLVEPVDSEEAEEMEAEAEMAVFNAGHSSGSLLMQLAVNERESQPELAGQSDGYVIGWCKVKYAKQLRGEA